MPVKVPMNSEVIHLIHRVVHSLSQDVKGK